MFKRKTRKFWRQNRKAFVGGVLCLLLSSMIHWENVEKLLQAAVFNSGFDAVNFTYDANKIDSTSGSAELKETALHQGLMGYWRMEESSWSGAVGEVIDSSGNGNHGQAVNGGTTIVDVGNPVGDRKGSFNGMNQRFIVPHDDSLSTNNEFTFSAFVTKRGPGQIGWTPLISKGLNANYFVGLWATTNEIYFTYHDGTSWHDVLSGLSLTDGQEDFVSVRVKGTQVYFRVNGSISIKTKPTATLLPNSDILRVGGFNHFNGEIDELMIWNRKLTDAEELEIYNSGGGTVLQQYRTDNPTIYKTTGNTDPQLTAFTGFTETLGAGNAGTVKYQLSTDGTNWQYYTGGSWTAATPASNLIVETNTAAEVNTNISTFNAGPKTIFVKSFLVSDGSQPVVLDSVEVTYDTGIPGVTVSKTTLSLDEATPGVSETYTIVLDDAPSANVEVTVSFDANQVTVSPTVLTFTPGNFNTAQTITVYPIDDTKQETNPHISAITHAATSSDGNYNGISIAGVNASITENENKGVNLSQTSFTIDESGGGNNSTYTVVLGDSPNAGETVTVDLTSNAGAVTVSPSQIIFTEANYSNPQTITVTAVDNEVQQSNPHSAVITHAATSGDGDYDGISILNFTANINEDDTAGVTITQSGGSTDVLEGDLAGDTYTVVLNSEPISNVIITLTNPDGRVNFSPGAPLIFAPGNWNMPQTVTLTRTNNTTSEGNLTATVSHAISSSDPNYSGVGVSSVNATVIDDDTPGLTISPANISIVEGGTGDTYTVKLNTDPVNPVTVNFASTVANIQFSPTSLNFNSGNFSIAQTVTVTAPVADGNNFTSATLSHSVVSTGSYNGIGTVNVTGTIADADDVTAPAVSAVSSSDISNTEVQMSFNSDEGATPEIKVWRGESINGAAEKIVAGSTVATHHTVSISGLVSCATYFAEVSAKDVSANNNVGVSTQEFTTSGCVGNSPILKEKMEIIPKATGGNITLVNEAEIQIPTSFTTLGITDANFQIKKLQAGNVKASIGSPTDQQLIDGRIFDFLSLRDTSSAITSFDQDLTVKIEYDENNLGGVSESEISLYSHDGVSWTKLSGCTVDTNNNFVSCPTNHFSTFGLFGPGQSEATRPSSETRSPSSGKGGIRRAGQSRSFVTEFNSASKEGDDLSQLKILNLDAPGKVLTYINRNGFEVFRGYQPGKVGLDRFEKRMENEVKFRGFRGTRDRKTVQVEAVLAKRNQEKNKDFKSSATDIESWEVKFKETKKYQRAQEEKPKERVGVNSKARLGSRTILKDAAVESILNRKKQQSQRAEAQKVWARVNPEPLNQKKSRIVQNIRERREVSGGYKTSPEKSRRLKNNWF